VLGYFPPPYPDEALYSICARYRLRCGLAANNVATRELFGVSGPVNLRWPTRLGYLARQLPPQCSLTVDRIIDLHTLAPFLRPFLSKEAMAEFRTYMSGETLQGRLGSGAGSRDQAQRLKFCAECAQEDRRTLGEAYWHRLHQLGIVAVCPKHKCHLSSLSIAVNPSYRLISAEEHIPDECAGITLKLNSAADHLLLWRAQQVSWLLNNPHVEMSVRELLLAYQNMSCKAGFGTIRGRCNYKKIREALGRNVASLGDLYGDMCASEHADSTRSLNRALRIGDAPPGLHLSLMKLLAIDAASLTEKAKQCDFEPGPWPCLNVACQHYGQSVIEDIALKRNNHGTRLGTFRCQCGYTYSRRAPDLNGNTRNCPHKIVATGGRWNRRLAQVAAELRCSTTQVRKMVMHLNLPLRKRLSRSRVHTFGRSANELWERKRQACRTAIQEIRTQAPTLPRSLFYAKARREMCWLLKHDRMWLEGVLPMAKCWGSKVDWREKDRMYARLVQKAKLMLMREGAGSLCQISKRRLAKVLAIDPGKLARGYLPRTLSAVTKASESSDAYRLRKLFWIVQGDAICQFKSFTAVLTEAGIRTNMRNRAPFAEAIPLADGLFMRRRSIHQENANLDSAKLGVAA
jgi:Tn7-like transposition protein D/TniQ